MYSGDFRWDAKNGRLLHGNAGISSPEVNAFRLNGNDFVPQEGTGTYGTAYTYGGGGTTTLATDSSTFYYGRMQVDALDVAHYLRSFPEAIYAANADYAFANGRLYDAHNGALMVILPFSTTIYALNPQGSDFWAYDAATNTIHHFANAAAVVTPGAVDFGGTSLNTTSLPVTVDVKNISPNPVTVTSVAAPAGFTIASNSCGALVGYASCAITLVASPTAQGAAAGSLVVYHSGGGPTSVSLSMLGERSMVSHYYQAALNRAPEPSGKSFWESEASRMVSLGADINEVWYVMATYFFNSAEYSSYNKTDTQFVTDLYNTFFNRAPDAGGLAFWVGQIGGGMPRQVVLSSFMFSPDLQYRRVR